MGSSVFTDYMLFMGSQGSVPYFLITQVWNKSEGHMTLDTVCDGFFECNSDPFGLFNAPGAAGGASGCRRGADPNPAAAAGRRSAPTSSAPGKWSPRRAR